VRDSSTARPSRVSHLAWINEWNKKQKPFVCYSAHADAIRRALAEKCHLHFSASLPADPCYERCQGSGVGSKLLFHALMQIAAASRYVGFEVVVVHAIDSDAVAFYAQRGFTQFEDHELHLFMPVKNLLATLET
jgi:hypothetical protein